MGQPLPVCMHRPKGNYAVSVYAIISKKALTKPLVYKLYKSVDRNSFCDFMEHVNNHRVNPEKPLIFCEDNHKSHYTLETYRKAE